MTDTAPPAASPPETTSGTTPGGMTAGTPLAAHGAATGDGAAFDSVPVPVSASVPAPAFAFVPASFPASAPPQPVPLDQLRFDLPPAFDDVAAERRHRKERLAAALRLFGRYGYEEGVAGHITARDPEFTDHFWVNPFGMPFRHVTVGDLILVNHAGQVVEGRFHVNQAAFAIHSQIHRARPDVVAAAHTHSVHGRAFSTLGRLLDPITQDVCAFYEDHALFDDYTGVVLDAEEGRRIAATLGPHKAVILRNHGLLTVGDSVDAAAWWFIAMDRSCQVQLAATAAGTPVPITHDNAVLTRTQLGNDLVAWINYQPLHQQILRSEPDLLG